MEFDFNQQPGLVRTRDTCKKKVKALVSIITPFYNGSKYFEQTFNCVINQTFPWFEWIIVDDGSKHEELEYLKEITEIDTRIKIYTKKNGGPANTRNYAIDRTNTEIIVSLDADDLISPTYIETTYWALYFNPDAGWAYTDSLGFGVQNYTWKMPFDSEKLKIENYLIEVGTIRKKALIEAGKYDDREKHSHEDWRLWLQLLSKGYHPLHLGYYGAWYRRIDDGCYAITANDEINNERAYKKIKEVADTINCRITAVEYPICSTRHPLYNPKMLNFEEEDIENNDKIKILLMIPWMIMGGADKFNKDFVATLDRDKFDISIISTVGSENEWRQKFEKYTDKIYTLPDFLDPAYYLDFVGYYIKSRKINILIDTDSYMGYYMMPWLRKNFPQLCIIDYIHMEEWYWRAGGYARISGMMGRFIDKTFVCNSATKDVMVNVFGRDKDSVHTMYIGVDADDFDRNKTEQKYLYENFNIECNREIILFPCRIHPQKRPFLMMEIAKKVYEKKRNALFVVVGDGEQLEELRNAIRDRKLDDAIICIGRSDKMKECYRDAKLTLICSLKEGLALTAYESCSMGVPVITSDVGGQKDLIDTTVGAIIPVMQSEDEDLDNRVFDEIEIQAFVDAILELLENKDRYEQCSKNCRERIEKGFTIKNMAENMKNEILQICNDEALKEEHKKQSIDMAKYGLLADEVYTLQLSWEKSECEAASIWNERQWLANHLENEIRIRDDIIHKYEFDREQMSNELQSIKTLRLWPMVEWYCRFVGENPIGKKIYSVLKKLFGKNSSENRHFTVP